MSELLAALAISFFLFLIVARSSINKIRQEKEVPIIELARRSIMQDKKGGKNVS